MQKVDARKALRQLPDLQEQATDAVNCLNCAACCKNYSPRFKTHYMKRICQLLRLKESAFIERYLRLDKDGNYVAKSSPCPFLGADNGCSICEHPPSDCRRFPYTDEDVLLRRPALTVKNASFCPILFLVLEALVPAIPGK